MSLFLVFGAYLASKSLFVGTPLYGRLSGIMPVEWWSSAVGMVIVIALVREVIAYRLRVEKLGWEAAGWGAPDIPREAAWAAACALAVLVIQETLLTSGSNQSSVSRWSAIADSGVSGRILALISIGLLTGVAEELVYRGALRAFLRRGAIVFVAVSACVFAAMHGLSSGTDYAVYALIGGVFAWTLVASSSLRAVMMAHVFVNSIHVMGWGWYLRLPRFR